MGHAQNGFKVSSCIFTIYENFAFYSLNPCLYSTDLKGEYTWCYRERQHVFPEASCLPRTYLHCYTQGRHFERQVKLKMTSYVKRSSIQVWSNVFLWLNIDQAFLEETSLSDSVCSVHHIGRHTPQTGPIAGDDNTHHLVKMVDGRFPTEKLCISPW